MAATISTSGVYSRRCIAAYLYNARLFYRSSVLRQGDFNDDEISSINDNRAAEIKRCISASCISVGAFRSRATNRVSNVRELAEIR